MNDVDEDAGGLQYDTVPSHLLIQIQTTRPQNAVKMLVLIGDYLMPNTI